MGTPVNTRKTLIARQFPQSAMNSTDLPFKKSRKNHECNLTEFWILLNCSEVGRALIEGLSARRTGLTDSSRGEVGSNTGFQEIELRAHPFERRV